MTCASRFAIAAMTLFVGCGRGPTPKHTTDVAAVPRDAALPTADGSLMQQPPTEADLQMIRNDTIKFGNYRPPEATLPTRGRKIMILGPADAVRLAHSGDLHVVDSLVPLLADPDRAWAAEVMLSAMTGHDSDLVLDYESNAGDFLKDFGHGLEDAWKKWLAEFRDRLQWDDKFHRFVVK